MRSTILLTGLAGLTGLLAACGDDSGTPADAKTVDTMQGSDAPGIDAHMFKEFDADEGGEVRLEYINFTNGNVGARATAYFYKNPGTPAYHDFINQMGQCTDTWLKGTESQIWPEAQNADRVYFDVGGQVVVQGQTEAGMAAYTIPRTNDAVSKDPFGRQHSGPWYFDGASSAENNGATYFAPGTSYTVSFPGSSEIPAQIFQNAVYMPQTFALTNPTFTTPTTLSASGNSDMTFEWDVANDAPPGVEVLSLVAFTGGNGPAIVCIEPNDGSVTIPGAMLDLVAQHYPYVAPPNPGDPVPVSGTFARQTLTHQVRELYDENGPTGRRVDFIGVWCYAKGFYTAQAL